MPGVTWNSCCSPCPHRVRRATHHMWSAFLFHGQVQFTIRLCEIAGKPPQGKLHPCRVFIKDPQKSHRCWVHFKEGIFCSIHSPPTWLHFSKSEDTAFTIYCLHHRTALTKWHLAFCPSTSLSKELRLLHVPGPHLCPRVTRAKLPRLPLDFAKTVYPSWPTLSEWTQSHCGALEDAPLCQRMLRLHFLLHSRPPSQAGTAVS